MKIKKIKKTLFAETICIDFKMNIIFILTLVVCLLDLSVAARLRDNLNVLVPNNDVNLHAKIKTLLNGDEVDPEDFSDNEIESLSEMKNPKIEKLHKKNIQNANKIFDDVNKNIEENLIDREDVVPSVEVAEISDDLNSTLPSTEMQPTSPGLTTHLPTTTNMTTSYPTTYQPTELSTTSTLPGSSSISPNSTNTTSTSFIGTSTTNLPTTTNTSTLYPATSNPTYPDNSTTLTASTFVTTDNNVTESTSDSSPYWESTTSFSEVTTNSSMPSTEVSSNTTDSPSNSTEENLTSLPIIDDNFRTDECLLGKADRYLPWLNEMGGLNIEYITNKYGSSAEMADLSRKSNSSRNFDLFINSTISDPNGQNITVSLKF